jgi:hypothetical protein
MVAGCGSVAHEEILADFGKSAIECFYSDNRPAAIARLNKKREELRQLPNGNEILVETCATVAAFKSYTLVVDANNHRLPAPLQMVFNALPKLRQMVLTVVNSPSIMISAAALTSLMIAYLRR